jgi:hypothetical protein
MSGEEAASAGVGDCEYPVRLQRRVIDTRTGELTEGDFAKRCGSRRQSDCPSCSALFQGDAAAVLRSGLFDADGKAKAATWVTLTAPGADVFGNTHSQRRDATGRVRPCRCKVRHADGDPLLGTPLDPNIYRYDLAADFNEKAPRLFAVTVQKLSRMLGRKLVVARVAEYQSRGVIHIHALVLGVITQRSLRVAINGGRNLRTGRTVKAAESGGWRWGPQCKAELLTSGHAGRLVRYMTKVVGYAVKSAGEDLPEGNAHSNRMATAGLRSCKCSHPSPVCACGSTAITERQFVVPSDGPATATTVQIGTYQSERSRLLCRKHKTARRGWGFRGQILTTSRTWGLTFSQARERRQRLGSGRTSEPPAHLLVEWKVVGRGYGPEGLRLRDLADVALAHPDP